MDMRRLLTTVLNALRSWQGDAYGILYQLIDANDAGISVYAAAGNDNVNAKNTYPCANVQTKCIAAVDNTYNKAKFSNFGSVVDYIAPGKDIRKYAVGYVTLSRQMLRCFHLL